MKLAIALCVAITVFASCSSKKDVKTELRISPKDSLAEVIIEREKTNGVLRLSPKIICALAEINQTLLNSAPGDKVGKIKISCYGENRSLLAVPVKLGHEKFKSSKLMFYPGPELSIDCFSGEVCDGIFSKQYDPDGIIINQKWMSWKKIEGKKASVFYTQRYYRNEGTFYESFSVYFETKVGPGPLVERLSWEHSGLKNRPELPNEDFVAIGGPPEIFYHRAIEAFRKLEGKKDLPIFTGLGTNGFIIQQ